MEEVSPSEDIEIEDGDVLSVPKVASFVLVSGQVYSPSAPTSCGAGPLNGISSAGNITEMGNKKDIFVIRADGRLSEGAVLRRLHLFSSHESRRFQRRFPEKIVGTPVWKNLLTIAQMLSAASLTAVVAGVRLIQMMSSVAITAGLAGGASEACDSAFQF